MALDQSPALSEEGTYLTGPHAGMTPDEAAKEKAISLSLNHLRTTESLKNPAAGDKTQTEMREPKSLQDLAEILRLEDPNSNYSTWGAFNLALQPILGMLFAFLTSSAEIGDGFYQAITSANKRPTPESLARDMGIKPNSLETASANLKEEFPQSAAYYRERGMPDMTITPGPASKT